MTTKLEPGTEVAYQRHDTETEEEHFSGTGTVVVDDGRRVALECQGGNTVIRFKDPSGALRVPPPKASSN